MTKRDSEIRSTVHKCQGIKTFVQRTVISNLWNAYPRGKKMKKETTVKNWIYAVIAKLGLGRKGRGHEIIYFYFIIYI